jgi:Ca-activated chloride channel family protein
VVGRLNQLYARQTKYFVVEVEVPAGRAGSVRALGQVSVAYRDLATQQRTALNAALSCRYAAQQKVVDAARAPRVTSSVGRLIGAETNRTAMELRDRGKVEEARQMLLSNAQYLDKTASATGNRHLARDAEQNRAAARNLDENQWRKQRKTMSKEQQEQLRALGYIESDPK